ncbi:beta-lactamase family protein [Aminipila butyrica]|uniref:Beta-lactamase family protein n=1 Tax=Aminipila butyrica TaxID=433296 RepID=A0A858BYP6_9FIRM|nr:serine hydrolase [Aminipila butyrica]QIB69824.1 beta-lactamase family protein [Aminipila butyrica]
MKDKIAAQEPLILREMDFWQVPGLALTVVKKGQEPYTKAFGWRDKERDLKATDTTLFGIASCSKAMTSALIARLVAEGLLDYDTPVIHYIPDFALMDKEATAKMTLRDMLCHRTGLGGHDAIWPVAKNLKEFTQAFPYLQPSAPFRSRPQYSNILYAAIGLLAETVTGKPWAELMQTYIFDPLGMTGANCQAEALSNSVDFAHPYQVLEGKLTKLPIWNVDVVAPAASVNCTAIDMSKWLTFLISKGREKEGLPWIPESIFETMIAKQVNFPDALGSQADLYPTDGYAMGWQTGSYRGRSICKHMGKIEGYSSIQAFLPDDQIGISILLNLHSPAVSITHTLLYTLLDTLLALPKVDWTHKFRSDIRPTAEDYQDCTLDFFSARFPDSLQDAIPSQNLSSAYSLKDCQGVYYNPGYGLLTIESREGQLYMNYRDMSLPMTPCWTGNFRVTGVKEDILTLTLPLSFIWNAQGKSIGLRIPFELLVDDILFLKKD